MQQPIKTHLFQLKKSVISLTGSQNTQTPKAWSKHTVGMKPIMKKLNPGLPARHIREDGNRGYWDCLKDFYNIVIVLACNRKICLPPRNYLIVFYNGVSGMLHVAAQILITALKLII